MLIPLSWLKEYVPVKIPFRELAVKLSSAGLTVETWQEKDNDIIFDPEVTPNRPDWLSVVGVAREVAAVTGSKLTVPDPKPILPSKIKNPLEIKIKDNPDICPRVTTVIIRGVQVKQSPASLIKRIEQIGLRPINNLVDITNFVLWEFGNPLHVFDYDKIRGKTMITELSKGGEDFKSLDGINYRLPKNAIIIKDVGRVIDLPPIKGGENTAVTNSTKNVLLHSIVCDPVLTRRASQTLNLRSDSSAMSERGVDPNGTVRTVLRALELILELAGGEVASDLIDLKDKDFKPWDVELNHKKLEKVLGTKINPKKVVDIFERLGLHTAYKTNTTHTTYSVTIPTFRNDLHIEEDLIEEVGRTIRYDNFPKTLPTGAVPTTPVAYAKNYDFDYQIKQILKGAGYSEIYTYSLISEDQLIKLGINPEKVLRVDNPISRDYEYLRPYLIGNLLEAFKINLPNFSQVKLFELGKTYKGETLDKARETERINAIITGEEFLQAKGDVELLLQRLNINYHICPIEKPDLQSWNHPGRSAKIQAGEEIIGSIFELHPTTLARFGIKKRATAWTLHYYQLERLVRGDKKYQHIPKYPAVVEDLALEIPEKALYNDVAATITKASSLVATVELIDTHDTTKTIRITYLDPEGNLTDKEIAVVRSKILKNLKSLGVRQKDG